jgi:hypothetical protein
VIVSDRDFVHVVLEEALGALVTEGLNHAAEYAGYRDTVDLDVRVLSAGLHDFH